MLEGSSILHEEKDTGKGTTVPSGSGKPGADDSKDLQSPINLETVSSSEGALEALSMETPVQSFGKRKVLQLTNISLNESVQDPDDLQNSSCKKQKKILALDVVTASTDAMSNKDADSWHLTTAGGEITRKDLQSESSVSHDKIEDNARDKAKDVNKEPKLNQSSAKGGPLEGVLSSSEWKPIEKELYLKGVEIFGRNRYKGFLTLNLLLGIIPINV